MSKNLTTLLTALGPRREKPKKKPTKAKLKRARKIEAGRKERFN